MKCFVLSILIFSNLTLNAQHLRDVHRLTAKKDLQHPVCDSRGEKIVAYDPKNGEIHLIYAKGDRKNRLLAEDLRVHGKVWFDSDEVICYQERDRSKLFVKCINLSCILISNKQEQQ